MQPKHPLFPLLILLALSAAGSPAFAQPTLEDYGALPEVGMMSVSPDGTMVAFRRHAPGRDLVLVYSLAEGKIARAIDVKHIRPSSLYFLDESRVILVASEGSRTSH